MEIKGSVAVITGGGNGIGEAIAHLLAQQGAHVIVSSRKLDGCQQVAEAISFCPEDCIVWEWINEDGGG